MVTSELGKDDNDINSLKMNKKKSKTSLPITSEDVP